MMSKLHSLPSPLSLWYFFTSPLLVTRTFTVQRLAYGFKSHSSVKRPALSLRAVGPPCCT
jgi:hypothetical protein